MERNKAYLALEKIGWGSYNKQIFYQCGFVIFYLGLVSLRSLVHQYRLYLTRM